MTRLNALFEVVVPAISAEHGHVDKFEGDGLMAVFGAPQVVADHADRAMCAALEIDRLVNSEGQGGGFEIGIGLNTGKVVAGSIGGAGRLNFSVIGDAVNVAARVEAETRETGDNLLLTEATRERLSEQFDIEPRGERVLKGIERPVRLFAPPARPQPAPAGSGRARFAPCTLASVATGNKAEGGVANPGARHGGRLAAKALRARGVTHLFTLSGGHLFSLYDGCREEGIEVIDVRHEQAAAFAAEGWAKATRTPGRLRPDGRAGRDQRDERDRQRPLERLADRRPRRSRRRGPLGLGKPPGDRPPAVRLTAHQVGRDRQGRGGDRRRDGPCDRRRRSGADRTDLPRLSARRRLLRGRRRHPGRAGPRRPSRPTGSKRAAELLAAAERPVIMAGTGLYWARAEGELREIAERQNIPVFVNGMGRGCIPSDHPLAFSRTRGAALGGADVAIVIGVPLDFRLGFGAAISADAKLIRIDVEPNHLERNRVADVDLVGDIKATLVGAQRHSPGSALTTPGSRASTRRRGRSAPRNRTTAPTTARRFTRCASTRSSARCSTGTQS